MRNIIASFHTAHVINTHLRRLRGLWIASFWFTLFLTKQITDAVIEIHLFLQKWRFLSLFSSPNMTFVLLSALWVLKVAPLSQVQSKGKFCRVFDLVPHILRPQDAPSHKSRSFKPVFETETLCCTSELADIGITCNSDLFVSSQRLHFLLGQRHIYESPASIGTEWVDCYPKG